MAKAPLTGSETGGRYGTMDEKKRKRMISNRESARRSREKKQKQMEEMIQEISILERKIKENSDKCRAMSHSLAAIESEKVLLRSEKRRLSNYMNNLEIILKNMTQNRDQKAETATGDCRRPRSLDFLRSLQPMTSSRLFNT